MGGASALCNLYSLNKKRDMVARFVRVSHNRAASFEASSGIFPRHIAPVVRNAPDGEQRGREPAIEAVPFPDRPRRVPVRRLSGRPARSASSQRG
jgi:hypothetical protein